MKLSTRLWLPTIVQLTVVVALAGLMAVRTQSNIAESNAQQAAQQTKLEDASDWRGLTASNIVRTLASVQGDDPKVAAALKPQIEATTAKISELQKRIESLADTPEEKDALAKVAETRKAYIAARDEVRKLKADGKHEEATAALDSKMRPKVEAYTAAQTAFLTLQQTRSNALREATGRDRMRTVWAVVGVMLVVVAGMAIGALLTVRAIARPMKELADTAHRIGEGDLTVNIDTSRHDEIGEVMNSLAHMRDALQRVVGEVQQVAESIQVASTEVASGNQDLSQRTEQAASNLQQTASSIEELTGTVRQSADSAAQANQLAASAQNVAQRGGEVVSQVVSTMDEINHASKKISDIIGTIDGIAFQTNILALNAAVEAARAGEQGRGFAVVAGEVRSLAQRSAEAAREIKSLIGASVEKVESGSRLVQDAGSTMSEIVTSVSRVTDIIGEISAAAGEQSSGIGLVNSAVSNLDQMTQQNAALVEESAAAAESLREQAHRLAEVVSTFKVNGSTARASHAVAAPRPAANRPASSLASAGSAQATATATATATRTPSPAPARPATPAPTAAPARPADVAQAAIGQARDSSARSTAPASRAVSDDDWETF
ncbi:methyl-accepting chemotaxis protein [Ideonella sp. DXS22W]|uniref:Methyl-accepting chemotaxis protein n=1 Tax=Pseudaquabacterium inlustre TaxID=2984192 RepID=A0ABU9CE40_9BURK